MKINIKEKEEIYRIGDIRPGAGPPIVLYIKKGIVVDTSVGKINWSVGISIEKIITSHSQDGMFIEKL